MKNLNNFCLSSKFFSYHVEIRRRWGKFFCDIDIQLGYAKINYEFKK